MFDEPSIASGQDMSSSSIQALWKILTNLSVSEALMFGFFALCAVGGALTAIFIAIRALIDVRKERRSTEPQGRQSAKRHG
jgi:hypothetical protein